MAGYDTDYIYCSPFLPLASLDECVATGGSNVFDIRDPADDPEVALMKAQDAKRLNAWATDLDPDIRIVAETISKGETQASLARFFGISEPAITKRAKRLYERGRQELDDLKDSLILVG